LFAIFGAVAVSLAALHYYDYFNTDYTAFLMRFSTPIGQQSSTSINVVLFNVSVFKKELVSRCRTFSKNMTLLKLRI
jgi:hypothetical protein